MTNTLTNRKFIILIGILLILPFACVKEEQILDSYLKVERFKLNIGTYVEEFNRIYLINNNPSSSSDSIGFEILADSNSTVTKLISQNNHLTFGGQLYASEPTIPIGFRHKISDIKIFSNDTVKTDTAIYAPNSNLADLFYVQPGYLRSFIKIEDLPKSSNFDSRWDDPVVQAILVFRDEIEPIYNQQFTFEILMTDSLKFTIVSPSISLD